MQKQREHNQSRPITGRRLASVERTEENEVNEDEGGGGNIKMKMI